MVRVCGVFGTWQLVTLVAALRQAEREGGRAGSDGGDILVLYETAGVTDEFKATLDRMARAAWPWRRIVWAYDLLTNRGAYSEPEFAQTLHAVRERVGASPEEVDQIWDCWLTRPAERLLYEAFPQARIVLYEDGLITYTPIGVAQSGVATNPHRSLRRRIRHWQMARDPTLSASRRFRYAGGSVDPRHLARVSRAYLQLTDREPLPPALAAVPCERVDYALLRAVLDDLAAALSEELKAGVPHGEGTDGEGPEAGGAERPRILVLGQALSRNGVMSRASETALYRSVVERVLDLGYSVLWKEHPRVSEPFFDEIADHARALGVGDLVQRLALPHAYPIELVAPRLRLAGCVVGTSAAPFYLKRLYGIVSFTFADELLPHMKGVDAFMNRMVRRECPPLSELPAALGASRGQNPSSRYRPTPSSR